MKKNYIKLSFYNEKDLHFKRTKNEDGKDVTRVGLGSYISLSKLEQAAKEAGFDFLPSFIVDILYKHGYSYNPHINAWFIITKGVAIRDERDADDPIKAEKIALSKAKLNAYAKAKKVFNENSMSMNNLAELFGASYQNIWQFEVEESKAFEKMIETGMRE